MSKINFIYYIIHAKAKLISFLFSNRKIDSNKIVIDNFIGKGYGDNLKVIVERLIEIKPELKIKWIVRDKNEDMPMYIEKIKYGSFKSMYEYVTAKVWIDNVRNNIKPIKRHDQIYLQTWHGPFSSKKIEKMAENNLSKLYVKEAKRDGKIVDAILSNSRIQDEQYEKYFWLSENVEILKYGFPRNDFIINNIENDLLINNIKEKLNVDRDSYLILYAPTFRDDYSVNCYSLDFRNILNVFENKINKKCKILIRLHPNVQKYSKDFKYDTDIINVTYYSNMQELALCCDSIISDYSSTLFDFAIQYKPAFICALDLEEYKIKRGLVNEYFNYPFPFSTSNEELISKINSFDYQNYYQRLKSYFKINPLYDDGNSTKKIVDWIIKKINHFD